MTYLPHVRSFENLEVYKKARALQRLIFQYSKCFPREEMYSLTDQIRRSSRSIGGQIAEAWAKRRYVRHFESKITDAIGELNETLHWINTAFDCEYISQVDEASFRAQIDEIGRMLGSMQQKAEQFCTSQCNMIRDEEINYLLDY